MDTRPLAKFAEFLGSAKIPESKVRVPSVPGEGLFKLTPIHFVSYSSLNNLHGCPRLLEIDKFGESAPELPNPDLAFGSAVGAGVQKLFSGGTLEEAWLAAFLAWDCGLLESYEKKNKSFPDVLEAIKVFTAYASIILQDWEVYEYEIGGVTRKATELSAKVLLPNGFQYRLFIDVVLRNRVSGQLLVIELKTTGAKRLDPAMYGNSNQGLSYGIILDKIASGNASFDVHYYVYSSSMGDWEMYPFTKDRVSKANWIRTVLFDTSSIDTHLKNGFFPKHGENCFNFYRPCKYYGACDMSKVALYAGPAVLEERVKKKLEENYDFTFTLEEIIDQQLDDINSAN